MFPKPGVEIKSSIFSGQALTAWEGKAALKKEEEKAIADQCKKSQIRPPSRSFMKQHSNQEIQTNKFMKRHALT